MAVDIKATGYVGIAFEATPGIYVAPTKFFPITGESLKYVQATRFRRVIRGISDVLGATAGYSHVEGDISMEVLPDVLPYFLYASRNSVAKAAGPPKVYTSTPLHGANPVAARTLSITVFRNGLAFGYVGCIVSSHTMGVDAGTPMNTFSIIGMDEASQTTPTPTYANQSPFGAGMYTIGDPTGTTVTDVDTFEFSVDDHGAAENRLATVTSAQFVRYGERDVKLSMTRDFTSRAEYDTFKALTARSVRIVIANGANAIVQVTVPVTIKDTYEIGGLDNPGDLIMATIDYIGAYDTSTSKAYEYVVTTTEDIT